MTKPILPAAALAQHIAVLGKTGSGKTSTAKLAIEQVVAAGARVCILDPIKSDWWGLISSADGNKPGLPFHILGGPRGHVPLHASAGKAIGEVVASGALPLSIIDMADFAPGGQAQFFVDFVPVLLRKMRGVLYLVMEEAHLFAPKERSGIGAENMSIHWAKTMATAGRSKGIRLMVLSQRTQALHNALLGSCDTLIAHRMTAPADQEPVIKWLKANVAPEIMKKVASSMSSLNTGEGWICSGEAKIFEARQFPKIHTYDNSKTPTNDASEHQVKAAPVDQDKLRAIIGEAVKEAEASDPRMLRRRIAELEKQVGKPVADVAALQAEYWKGASVGYKSALSSIARQAGVVAGAAEALHLAAKTIPADIRAGIEQPDAKGFATVGQAALRQPEEREKNIRATRLMEAVTKLAPPPRPAVGEPASLSKAERAILSALAQYPQGRNAVQCSMLAGYSHTSGGYRNALGSLRSRGLIIGGGTNMKATEAGLSVLGPYDPLPTGDELRAYWLSKLGKASRTILQALFEVYPEGLDKQALADRAGYQETSGGYRNSLGEMRTLELINRGSPIKASEDFFQ